MAAAPTFSATKKAQQCQPAGSNTARDGSGSNVTSGCAPAGAGLLRRTRIVGVGTVTAGIVRVFVSYDGGTTKRLLHEEPVSSTTPSGTVAGWERTLEWYDMLIPNGSFVLYFTTHNAETFNFITEWLED